MISGSLYVPSAADNTKFNGLKLPSKTLTFTFDIGTAVNLSVILPEKYCV